MNSLFNTLIAEKKINIASAVSNKKLSLYHKYKRIFDILVAVIGLTATAPIIIICALLVKFESKGPMFYRQERIGLNGKPFFLYKVRSMQLDAEKDGPQWANKTDNRITKTGIFIRKTRIDELPQLVNVLKGDMALIGPRPERKFFIDQFIQDIPYFNDRLKVKPGLTGWAQVNGGYDISAEQKVKLDIQYIQKEGIMIDLKIIFATIYVIFTGHGAR